MGGERLSPVVGLALADQLFAYLTSTGKVSDTVTAFMVGAAIMCAPA